MTAPRSTVVTGTAEGVYHCISRCVRRAYLCGYDNVSGRCFDHRKGWVHARLKLLAEVFCIEVLAYALMSNHQHTLLRTRPDVLEKITDEEVARRWLRLYPNKVVDEETAFAQLMNQKQRLVTLRKRLGSISWFMKSLSEHIARRANKEDQCKGRFWEGRFRCQRVCDEAARLACSIYIDLNPIRAELAKTPEKSKYTSAWERIRSIHRNSPAEREPSLWIAPIHSTEKRRGYLSISLPEYLQLLDATGREVHRGKKGRIPNQLAPILERIGVKTEHWLDTITHYGRWFALFSGKKNSLQVAAIETGRRWVKGSAAAARVFT